MTKRSKTGPSYQPDFPRLTFVNGCRYLREVYNIVYVVPVIRMGSVAQSVLLFNTSIWSSAVVNEIPG